MTGTLELSDAVNRILPLIDALSPAEKVELEQYILTQNTEDKDFWSEWGDTIETRLSKYESGEDPGVSGDEVMARLREKYG